MNTLRTATLAVALIAGGTAGDATAATKTTPRRATYIAHYVLPLYETNQSVLGFVFGGSRFTPPSWSRYASAVVTDDTGATLPFAIREHDTGGVSRDRGTYCGRTAGSVGIDPTAALWVYVNQGPCADGTVGGVGTRGTVTVTFSDTR